MAGEDVVISDPLMINLAGPLVVEELGDPFDSFCGVGGGKD